MKSNTPTIKIMLKNGGQIIGDFKDHKHIIRIALDNENFPDDNKAALLELVSAFCDGYLEVNSREYLDALP